MTISQPECICRDATSTTPTADGIAVKVDWTWNPLCPVHKPAVGDLPAWLTAILDEQAKDAGNPIKGEIHARDCESIREHIPFPCECGVPERILARIAADRQILAVHSGERDWPCQEGNYTYEPCETLKACASAYADRPGYPEAWKP